jgi:hypothetical protein
MEFSRESKLEAITELNRTFAENIGIKELLDESSRQEILKMIQQADEKCFRVLAAFNNAWLALDYVRGDKELRMKVEEVWKMEVERHRSAFETCMEDVVRLAAERRIDLEPLMLRMNWL